MKNLNFTFFLLVFFGFGALWSDEIWGQQYSQYTTYRYNTMQYNPAYTGQRGRLSVLALYRNQWVGIEGAPKTLNLSLHTPVGKEQKVGLGLEFMNDQIGPSDKNLLAANFSYVLIPKTNIQIAFGIKAGISTLNLDPNKLNIYDRSNLHLNMTHVVRPVLGAGIYFYTHKWYIGLSTPNFLETKHYNEVKISIADERTHFYLMGGYVFTLNKNVLLKPIAILKGVAGAPLSLDLAVNTLLYEKVSLGVGYRLNTAVSFLAGFQINEYLMLGYAYDYALSELMHYNSGSHEIFLRVELLKSVSDRQSSPL